MARTIYVRVTSEAGPPWSYAPCLAEYRGGSLYRIQGLAMDVAEGDTLEFQVDDLVRCRYIKLRPPEGWSHLGTCLRPVAVERICPS